ncbi:MAG: hypothetical protein KIS94_10935 [Chitinophagales bacterium]|nr:hypothetical protein [Chitinophagales bacterium]
MKHVIALLLVSAFVASATAQDAKKIFNSERIVWFGLDFTKAKLVGVTDEKPDVIVSTYLELWNQPMMYEADKFPIGSTFRKTTVQFDPEVVKERNKKVTKESLFGGSEAMITTAAIEQMISEFPIGAKKDGVGVVFFVESFNKKKKLATAHVAFFDIATHKLLLTKRLTGEPGGGGLKYYWANSFSRMFHDITATLYDQWMKEAK